jgi:hypothetical protein
VEADLGQLTNPLFEAPYYETSRVVATENSVRAENAEVSSIPLLFRQSRTATSKFEQ